MGYNFKDTEFSCSCCGLVMADPDLIRRLTKLRDLVKKPVVITSGYRCQAKQDRLVKEGRTTTKKSPHTFGWAADIKVVGMSVEVLAGYAEKAGFDGIGVYKNSGFVHVDVRGYPSRWLG